MGSVGSYEAKTNLSKLLKRIAAGEHITITKHGISVAVLIPAKSSKKAEVHLLIQKLRDFRKGRTLGKIKLKDMIEEGRKY